MAQFDNISHAETRRDVAAGRIHSLIAHFPPCQSDVQLARLVLGNAAELWPHFVRQFEREGLPVPRSLFGNMRYAPIAMWVFDRREGLPAADLDVAAKDHPERFEP
jgi:hypothetical protein